MFNKLYENQSTEIIEKNIVALLVEIDEFVNETRCFKYWTSKLSSLKEVILEEHADCLTLVL